MIPILKSTQIREADAHTIAHEPIASIDLMERATAAFVSAFMELPVPHQQIIVLCGTGNNGGDGLAVARMLRAKGLPIRVVVVGNVQKATPDFLINLDRLSETDLVDQLSDIRQMPALTSNTTVIDALLGSGLTRPVEGLLAEVILTTNESSATRVSIDMPSGLFAEKARPDGAIFKAHFTISFEVPKLAFFQPTLHSYVGNWRTVPIGLKNAFVRNQNTTFYLTESADIQLPHRTPFMHKGDAGRLLLIGGSTGKAGAAILAAKAAMRAGCGLLFVHAPEKALTPLQVAVPEAQVMVDQDADCVTALPSHSDFNAVAIGPGLGTHAATGAALELLLRDAQKSLLLDADGLNLLSTHRHLLEQLPAGSVLTPHPGEFRRLAGEWTDDFHKLELLAGFCSKYQVHVVLKGAWSAVCRADGHVFFNPTGNPGMATAGSGDVLTGIVGALMAQGLAPFEALRTGVYVHGLAGDLASAEKGMISLTASDIISWLPEAFKNLA